MSTKPNPHTTQKRLSAQARRLFVRRRQLQLTQKQVAQRADMPDCQYARYEQGRAEPSPPVLRRLAEALECTSDHIIGLSAEPNDNEG